MKTRIRKNLADVFVLFFTMILMAIGAIYYSNFIDQPYSGFIAYLGVILFFSSFLSLSGGFSVMKMNEFGFRYYAAASCLEAKWSDVDTIVADDNKIKIFLKKHKLDEVLKPKKTRIQKVRNSIFTAIHRIEGTPIAISRNEIAEGIDSAHKKIKHYIDKYGCN